MKNFGSLILVALFALINSQSASAQQGQLERSIIGVVVAQEQEDKETKKRSVMIEIRLDSPADSVDLELPNDLRNAAEIFDLGTGFFDWNGEKGKSGITWTNNLPSSLVRLRIDFPQNIGDKLDKLLKDGLKFKFKNGGEVLGTETVNVKKTDPPGVITDPARVGLPPRLYSGLNSFSPPEGYTNGENGTWSAKVKTKKGTEELPVSPVLTDEEFKRGVDYRFPKKDPLDLNNLTLQGSGPRPENPFRGPFPPLGFMVPPGLPPGTEVEITYVNGFGQTVVGARVTTDTFHDLGLPPFLITCTPKIFAGDYLCVCGFFPTQFIRNQLLLDGKPLGKLAGTSDAIVFQPKGLKPGRHVIEWNVEAFNDPLYTADVPIRQPPSSLDEVAFVLLEVQGTIDQNALFTGQGTTLRLRIIGSEEQLPIELTNKTPQIIEMEGGTSQVVKSSGGSNNVVEKRVKGSMRGNFDIIYRLALPPCPCNPGLTAEVMELTGQVDDAPQTPPTTQPANTQTTAPRQNCELIFQECTKAEAEVYQIESEYEKALNGCRKGRGANDPKFYADCVERTKARYGPKLKEAYLKELECYKRWQECVKSLPEAPKPPEASPPLNALTGDYKPNIEEICNKTEAECKRLDSKREGLVQSRKTQLAKCRVNNKLNQQALEECQKAVFDYFEALINEAGQKAFQCRRRLEACRAKQRGQ